MNPRGEPGETFEQSFDVWVGADFLGLAINGEAARNLRIFAREFTCHVPQMPQLGVVEAQEAFIHAINLPVCNVRSRYPFAS